MWLENFVALERRTGRKFLDAAPSVNGRDLRKFGCVCFPPLRKLRERMGHPNLLADAELTDHGLIALGIVFLEVVEQATPLADQHEKAAA